MHGWRGAADADDDQNVGVGADALGGAADAAQLVRFLKGRQVQPAEEIVPLALALHQGLMRGENFGFGCEHIRQRKVAPDVGYINFQHVAFLLCDNLPLCYCKFSKNSTFFCPADGKMLRDTL